MAKNDITKVWKYYEDGRAYNNRLTPNQYRLVNSNIEFFAGNQWLHLPETQAMARLPKPVFNIIKRVASLFIASLTTSAVTINFEPLQRYGEADSGERDAAQCATAEVRNLFEKFKIDYRIRDALFDGAQTGDYCAHFYWDPEAEPYGGTLGNVKGEICMELVDGINIMFGNPNTHEVEKQPYILVIGRDTVENLKKEAASYRRLYGAGSSDGGQIRSDSDTYLQAGQGGKIEIVGDDTSGKALYCYCYTKKTRETVVKNKETGEVVKEIVFDENGEPVPELDRAGKPIKDFYGNPVYKMRPVTRRITTVYVTKATKDCVIFEDIDTGLSHYPIAWGNWERQKNQYHGRALVTGIIPNQIFINTMFAMVMRHLQLLGFPKTVYNADLIGQWSNEVGQAIGVRNLMPGQSVADVAANLQPADMSNQIIAAIDKAMSYTKDCLGATDAQLGSVNMDNTSALMVLQSTAEIPLENVRANLHEWVENIGAILLDMMGTYYGVRPAIRKKTFRTPVTDSNGLPVFDKASGTLVTEEVQQNVMETFDFSIFKNLWLSIGADVGATTYYSEISMMQMLDNLRAEGAIDIIEYLERVPEKLLPRKAELIESLKQKLQDGTIESGTAAAGSHRSGSSAGSQALTAAGNYDQIPKATRDILKKKLGL